MLFSFSATIAAFLLQAGSPQPDPALLFGAREEIEQASISPDGTHLAFLGPGTGQGSALFVVPLDGSSAPKRILESDGNPERLSECRWAAATRLVCSVYGITMLGNGELTYFDRYVAVDADGGSMKLLFSERNGRQLQSTYYGGRIIDWLPREDGAILMTRRYIPEYSTGTHLAQTEEGLGVDRTDTRTGRASAVEKPLRHARNYIADGQGNVRIAEVVPPAGASGYDGGRTQYLYRPKAGGRWQTLSSVSEAGEGFMPEAVDPSEDVAYGLKRLNGRLAAYKVALDGSLKETLVFAHPDVDVSGFIRVGRAQRVVGVSFMTDRAQAFYFDAALDKLSKSLARAIPQLPLIRLVDSSSDETKLLLWAGSDTHPGRYYLFDRTSKQLNELLDVRPKLSKATLASVQAVSYPAADGTQIPGYLTLPPGKDQEKGLPAIVLPHGGPGSRDTWGFDWLAQYFAHRGYAVLQPNFRGSTGYGDAWFQKNGFRSWRTAIGDINAGARWLVGKGIADPKKLAIVGWSYGGYAALQSGVSEPSLFGAIVAIAPVADLDLLRNGRRAWSDFAVVSRDIGTGPEVDAGSPARHAKMIKAPVLLFHGSVDDNVDVQHSKLMADRLKDAGAKPGLVVYDKRDHYLDDSEARSDMLRRADGFIRNSLGL